MMKYIGHQGDIKIFEIESFPDGERFQDQDAKDCILARGEATGHAHQINEVDNVVVFGINDEKFSGLYFIDCKKDTDVLHGRMKGFTGDEADKHYHNPITLKSGKKYMRGIVKETDWLAKTVRRVVD